MKRLLLIAILLLPAVAFAQTSDEDRTRAAIGAIMSVDGLPMPNDNSNNRKMLAIVEALVGERTNETLDSEIRTSAERKVTRDNPRVEEGSTAWQALVDAEIAATNRVQFRRQLLLKNFVRVVRAEWMDRARHYVSSSPDDYATPTDKVVIDAGRAKEDEVRQRAKDDFAEN